jgi:DNA-binding transcriptional LysR family regulator
MDLRSLRYFVTVAERLSFSRAAETLNISQSALSRQVQLLEEQFGLQLFDRIGRRICLTGAGRELFVRSSSLLQEAVALRATARDLASGSKGTLRIGSTPQTLESLVARVLTLYRRKQPDIAINIVEDGSSILFEHLIAGRIDLAFAAMPPHPRMDARPLFPLGLLAVVPQSNRLARKRTLEVSDLRGAPLLLLRKGFMTRQLLDGACALANVNPSVLFESSNPHGLLALAEEEHGIAIIPSTVRIAVTRSRIVLLKYDRQQLGIWISLIWDGGRRQSPITMSFIEDAYRFTRKDYPGRQFKFDNLLDTSSTAGV